MTRERALPWYKAFPDLYRDAQYQAMRLPQQATFRNLFDHAAEQVPRGHFRIDNRRYLAALAARGSTHILATTIDYLSNEWMVVDEKGRTVPMLRLEKGGKTATFSTFAEHQRPPSQEPENQNRRQKEHRTRQNASAEVTDLSPLQNGGVTDLDLDTETETQRQQTDEEPDPHDTQTRVGVRVGDVTSAMANILECDVTQELRDVVEDAVASRRDLYQAACDASDFVERERDNGRTIRSYPAVLRTILETQKQPLPHGDFVASQNAVRDLAARMA